MCIDLTVDIMYGIFKFLSASIICLLPLTTFAHLGQKLKTTSSHQTQFISSSYSVKVTHLENVDVKEYVNEDGFVFAVTWRGLAHPDLSGILGSHFQEYQKLNTERRKGSKAQDTINTSNAVVRRAGHMRDVRGLAYDPSLVPSDVKVEELE